MKNEIVLFENQEIKLEVSMNEDTVWLTQKQMSTLFNTNRSTVTKHINNIFSELELDKKSNVQKMHIANSDKPITLYSLDVIISVGYRVKSKNGIIFRRWANKVLKDYLLKGYAVNNKRLEYLEKTVKLIDIASRIDEDLNGDDAKNIIKVIGRYSKSLDLLDNYDHKNVSLKQDIIDVRKVTYEDCIIIIKDLKFNEESNLFALERNRGLEGIISNIYQTFDGKDVYKSLEEKIANFFYLIIKNHVFIDGNKRIAATLFIYILQFYNLLYKDNKQIIDNNTLTALTLLIAESNPKEKDILINLITNFI